MRIIILRTGDGMKHRELTKMLKKNEWRLIRHGANHNIYTNGEYNIAVPRHKEIKERTARGIMTEAGIEWREL